MRPFYPDGKRLPALERAILKYRAFEMMIILFHVERLKSFLLGSVRATNKNYLPEGTKRLYDKLWAILIAEEIMSQSEADELTTLIDYRNQIAHDIQNLTFDVSRDSLATDYLRFGGTKYDLRVLNRIKHYQRVMPERMRHRFVLVVGLEELLFDSAKTTYELELRRLDRSIRHLIKERDAYITKINSQLESIAQSLLDRSQPGHPANIAKNGKLTSRGIDCCYSLFRSGVSDLAVSYLMRVSRTSIRARRKRWQVSEAATAAASQRDVDAV